MDPKQAWPTTNGQPSAQACNVTALRLGRADCDYLAPPPSQVSCPSQDASAGSRLRCGGGQQEALLRFLSRLRTLHACIHQQLWCALKRASWAGLGRAVMVLTMKRWLAQGCVAVALLGSPPLLLINR